MNVLEKNLYQNSVFNYRKTCSKNKDNFLLKIRWLWTLGRSKKMAWVWSNELAGTSRKGKVMLLSLMSSKVRILRCLNKSERFFILKIMFNTSSNYELLLNFAFDNFIFNLLISSKSFLLECFSEFAQEPEEIVVFNSYAESSLLCVSSICKSFTLLRNFLNGLAW